MCCALHEHCHSKLALVCRAAATQFLSTRALTCSPTLAWIPLSPKGIGPPKLYCNDNEVWPCQSHMAAFIGLMLADTKIAATCPILTAQAALLHVKAAIAVRNMTKALHACLNVFSALPAQVG